MPDGPWIADSSRWVHDRIVEIVRTSPLNSLGNTAHDRAWGDPLTGYSRGDDPLYRELHDREGFLLPEEIFASACPDVPFRPGDLTVISWILPQTEDTKRANRKEKEFPAESWARSRVFGDEMNTGLKRLLIAEIGQNGYHAADPAAAEGWKIRMGGQYPCSSTWSERHAAYVSGLGTFGLCDGLITPVGKAMRCGSVVTTLPVPASPRPYASRHEYCRFYADGSCMACMHRCPAGAITPEGHDKERCAAYLYGPAREHILKGYGFDGYACGLCQTAVPCESRIPAR
jgi:ferredoxin